MVFDAANNRLLVIGFVTGGVVQAIALPSGDTSTAAIPPETGFDGMAVDRTGNYYLSSYSGRCIYRYDNDFTEPPEPFMTFTEHPANIDINVRDNILVIPFHEIDSLGFEELDVRLSADTTWGFAPLTVNFQCRSPYEITGWSWAFGDGDSSDAPSPQHVYTGWGTFDVGIEIVTTESEVHTITAPGFITALADSMIAPQVEGEPGTSVEVQIYARNTIPVNRIRIPIEYPGVLNVSMDSFTVTGCRTENFDNFQRVDYSATNWRATFLIYNTPGSETPPLEPGEGPVLKVYFKIPSTATFGKTSALILDGYSSFLPKFYGSAFTYNPVTIEGIIRLPGICGDSDNSGTVNILDVTYIINYLYKFGPAPDPEDIADADGSGVINLLDVTYLVNYLYKYGPAPIC
jgi:hypothetical protein